MACPCCVPQTCFCSDPRTKNCTVTVSISVPEKQYAASASLSCSGARTVSTTPAGQFPVVIPRLDPGEQFFGDPSGFGFSTIFPVGGGWSFSMSDCPQSLSNASTFPSLVNYASQGCNPALDNGDVPALLFHFYLQLVNENNVSQNRFNRYAYFYSRVIDPVTSAVTLSTVWQGHNGVAYQCDPGGAAVRCVPCFFDTLDYCNVPNNNVGAGHCPSDITSATPTVTIACPP
jgi:hypothetical protein